MSNRTWWTWLVAAIVVVGFVAGCGSDDDSADSDDPSTERGDNGGDDDASSSDSSDDAKIACSLLDTSDVEDQGLTVDSGPDENELAPTDECNFKLMAEDDAGVADSVAIVVYSPSEAIALSPDTYPGTETVDGLGASAWYVDDLGLIQVRLDDDRVLSIQHITRTGDPLRPALEAWAETAAGRA